jgi:hypothetical protein
MARYYFDWRDDEGFGEDDEGIDLASLAAVKIEATRSLLERARDVLPSLARQTLSIEVRDSGNVQVLRVVLELEIVEPSFGS